MSNLKSINTLGLKHYNWVDSKGWHNKTALESIALIGSEIGEAIEESFALNQEKLSLEVADIYLRSMDLAVEFKMDLDKERNESYSYFKNLNLHIYGTHIIEHLAYLMIPLAKLANTTRYETLPPEFHTTLINFMLTIEKICVQHNINLFENIESKIKINEEKNHKNRVK